MREHRVPAYPILQPEGAFAWLSDLLGLERHSGPFGTSTVYIPFPVPRLICKQQLADFLARDDATHGTAGYLPGVPSLVREERVDLPVADETADSDANVVAPAARVSADAEASNCEIWQSPFPLPLPPNYVPVRIASLSRSLAVHMRHCAKGRCLGPSCVKSRGSALSCLLNTVRCACNAKHTRAASIACCDGGPVWAGQTFGTRLALCIAAVRRVVTAHALC